MFTEPPKKVIDQLPPLKRVHSLSPDKRIIHLHFFFLSCHWYVAAWVEKIDNDIIFYGFVNLDDPAMAEWGDFTLSQLKEVIKFTNVIEAHTYKRLGRLPLVVEWDEHWTPRPFGEIGWRNGP